MIDTSPSMTMQRVVVSLSREELYVIMRLLNASQLPGFDLTWLNATPDGEVPDNVRQTLDVAANALIARGYMSLQEPVETEKVQINIPSPVIALVGACIFGENSILLSLHTPDGPKLTYLHQLRELGVVHTVPLPDVHQFEALNGREGVLSVMNDMLNLQEQSVSTLPASKVLAVNMQIARDAAIAGKVDEAVELLVRGGLPAATAQELGKAMKEATALGSIIAAKREDDGKQRDAALAIVVTPTLCFALSDEDSHPSAFHVQPTSAGALRRWVASYLS